MKTGVRAAAAALALLGAPMAARAATVWTCRVQVFPASQDPHWYRGLDDLVFRVDGRRVFARNQISGAWEDLCTARSDGATRRCVVNRTAFTLIQNVPHVAPTFRLRLDFSRRRLEQRRGRALALEGTCTSRPE